MLSVHQAELDQPWRSQGQGTKHRGVGVGACLVKRTKLAFLGRPAPKALKVPCKCAQARLAIPPPPRLG